MDCDHPEVTQCEISVLFCDDTFIQELNKNYRKKDKPTDVLSFSAIEDSQFFSQASSLGDLVISLPTAKRQAKRFGVTLKRETTRLLVHGVLHLYGYDHERVPKRVAEKMRRKERELMRNL